MVINPGTIEEHKHFVRMNDVDCPIEPLHLKSSTVSVVMNSGTPSWWANADFWGKAAERRLTY